MQNKCLNRSINFKTWMITAQFDIKALKTSNIYYTNLLMVHLRCSIKYNPSILRFEISVLFAEALIVWKINSYKISNLSVYGLWNRTQKRRMKCQKIHICILRRPRSFIMYDLKFHLYLFWKALYEIWYSGLIRENKLLC